MSPDEHTPTPARSRYHLKAYLLRWLTLFLGLFVLTVPFPYHLLSSPGDYLAPLFAPLHRWLADAVFRVPAPYTLAVRSDSTSLYLHALVLLTLATLGAGLWAYRWPQRPRAAALWRGLHTASSYYLALQLLEYGFDKVFKHQFYLPEPNTLYTPLGQLTPDLLYWSTMGVSRPYTVFGGLIEVLPAALLLFRRPRALGGLLALGVLLNVAALNLSFDISVKLYSLFLLLLSVVAAFPALQLLYWGLIRRRPVELAAARSRPQPWQLGLKTVLIGLLLLETTGPFVQDGQYNDDRTPRPPLHGAYQVEWLLRHGDTLRPDAAPIKRVFVHRQGYFIVQTAADSLRDYQLSYGPGRLHLLDYDSTRTTLTYQPAVGGRLLLTGRLGPDSLQLLVRSLDWRRLPLLQPEFHWTTDSYQ